MVVLSTHATEIVVSAVPLVRGPVGADGTEPADAVTLLDQAEQPVALQART